MKGVPCHTRTFSTTETSFAEPHGALFSIASFPGVPDSSLFQYVKILVWVLDVAPEFVSTNIPRTGGVADDSQRFLDISISRYEFYTCLPAMLSKLRSK